MSMKQVLDKPVWSVRVSAGLGAYTMLGGLLSFLGWVLDVQRLTDWDGNGISIQPNAALCATIAGASLILLNFGLRRVAAMLGCCSQRLPDSRSSSISRVLTSALTRF